MKALHVLWYAAYAWEICHEVISEPTYWPLEFVSSLREVTIVQDLLLDKDPDS